jgi:hypothetical protein
MTGKERCNKYEIEMYHSSNDHTRNTEKPDEVVVYLLYLYYVQTCTKPF